MRLKKEDGGLKEREGGRHRLFVVVVVVVVAVVCLFACFCFFHSRVFMVIFLLAVMQLEAVDMKNFQGVSFLNTWDNITSQIELPKTLFLSEGHRGK